MSQPTRSTRRHGRPLLFALTGAALAACSDGITPPPQPTFSGSLQLISRNPAPAIAGELVPDPIAVRVLDAAGQPLAGVPVSFTTRGGEFIHPAQVTTDQAGYASAVWDLGGNGADQAKVSVQGATPIALRPRLVTVPDAARPMLARLAEFIPLVRQGEIASLPLNPTQTSFIEAKIALLNTPGLGSDILEQGRYEARSFADRVGAARPLVAVFPLESMRAEAVHYLQIAAATVPVLEEFMASAFPAPAGVGMWYGFKTGMSGGGGMMNLEDRTSFDRRTQGRMVLPYEAGIPHELGHSWVASESMAQFLEVYGDNVRRTGSRELSTWTYTRGWTPGRAQNEGVHALLDVYQMIGPDAMAAAFRSVAALRPAYGQPLTAAMQQVFVDAAPAAVKDAVAAKVARVRT